MNKKKTFKGFKSALESGIYTLKAIQEVNETKVKVILKRKFFQSNYISLLEFTLTKSYVNKNYPTFKVD